MRRSRWGRRPDPNVKPHLIVAVNGEAAVHITLDDLAKLGDRLAPGETVELASFTTSPRSRQPAPGLSDPSLSRAVVGLWAGYPAASSLPMDEWPKGPMSGGYPL